MEILLNCGMYEKKVNKGQNEILIWMEMAGRGGGRCIFGGAFQVCNFQGGREHCTVNYTGTQSFMKTLLFVD